jgi:hypothetical protein
MSIGILQNPWTDDNYKFELAYDGLPFVVTSSNKGRPNFQYVFDIYVGTSLVARLKRNPDIGTKLGVIELGRVIETYMSSDLQVLQALTYFPQRIPSHHINFNVRVGEEYDRVNTFSKASSALTFNQYFVSAGTSHNFRVGDRVYIIPDAGTDSTLGTPYVGFSTITKIFTTSFRTDSTWSVNYSGTYTEAEGFYDNSWFVNSQGQAKAGFLIPKSRPTRLAVGDTVTIVQDAGYLNAGYNGDWLVTGVLSFDSTYNIIQTNAPWLGSSPVNGGAIYTAANYNTYDITSSQVSMAINGGSNYKTPFNAADFYPTDSTTRFFTNAPDVQTCSEDEWLGLTYYNDPDDENRFIHYKIYAIKVIHSCTVPTPGTVLLSGDWTTYYKSGDIINHGVDSNVLTVTFDGTNTTIVTDGTDISVTIYLVSRVLRVQRFGSYSEYLLLEAPIGPQSVNTIPNYPLQGATRWDVWTANAAGDIKSETKSVKVQTECSNWTPFRIAWINRYGMWDQFTFRGGDIKTVDIEKSQFNKTRKSISSTNQWNYTTGDRGDTLFNVNAKSNYEVWSGNISKIEADWLEELYTSPQVIWLNDGDRLPINITNDTYTNPGSNTKGLRKLKLNFQVSWNENIQRG